MRRTNRSLPPAGPPGRCEIHLQGHLDDRWAERFGGLFPTRDRDGTTLLRGPLADQAALHGVLATIRDLGLALLSIRWTAPTTSSDPTDPSERKKP